MVVNIGEWKNQVVYQMISKQSGTIKMFFSSMIQIFQILDASKGLERYAMVVASMAESDDFRSYP